MFCIINPCSIGLFFEVVSLYWSPFDICSAEALDNHLTDVQRHHEYKSQIEEKKIRDDAAIEEAKRKQIALQEEKIRQERMKVEEVCKRFSLQQFAAFFQCWLCFFYHSFI